MTVLESEAKPGSALVVEDHAETRAALVTAVRDAFPGIDVSEAGTLHDGLALIGRAPSFRLALIDLGLPDGSGIELVRALADRSAETLAIVATIYDDDDHLFSAIAAGAAGYVLKDRDPQVLVRHLRQLDAGVPALSPSIARKLLAWFRERPETPPAAEPAPPGGPAKPALTPRETDVLALIARGLRVAEAAAVLGLSELTVASYVKVIYRKLGVSSRAEAALEAARRGLA